MSENTELNALSDDQIASLLSKLPLERLQKANAAAGTSLREKLQPQHALLTTKLKELEQQRDELSRQMGEVMDQLSQLEFDASEVGLKLTGDSTLEGTLTEGDYQRDGRVLWDALPDTEQQSQTLMQYVQSLRLKTRAPVEALTRFLGGKAQYDLKVGKSGTGWGRRLWRKAAN